MRAAHTVALARKASAMTPTHSGTACNSVRILKQYAVHTNCILKTVCSADASETGWAGEGGLAAGGKERCVRLQCAAVSLASQDGEMVRPNGVACVDTCVEP